MAYDPPLHETVLFGGQASDRGRAQYPAYLNGTWAFQNGSWTNISSRVGTPPSPRVDPSLTYDQHDGYLLLVGGQATEFGGPGLGYNDSANCAEGVCNDTWALEDGLWTRLPTPVSSPFHNGTQPSTVWEGSQAAYDSTDGFVLVQSAYDAANGTGGSTWSIQGSNWTDLSFNHTTNTSLPSPNCASSVLVNDPAAGGVLLFGGECFELHGGNSSWWVSNATWLYSHGVWTNVSANSTHTPPPNAWYAAGAYDNATGGVILTYRSITWEWKNYQWTNVTTQVAPFSFGSAMSWNPSSNATLLYGGFNKSSPSNLTWEWTSTPPLTDLALAASLDPVDVGVSTALNATFVGGVPPLHYSWQLGDGTTSNSSSPSHAYSAPGKYNVTLNLSDSDGHWIDGMTRLFVSSAPALNPHISPDPTDVGVATTFSANPNGGADSPGCSCAWTFGDAGLAQWTGPSNNSSGSSGNSPGPGGADHTYAVNGNFTPQVWWNDSGGISLMKNLSLQVNPALSAPTILAIPSAPYLGQLVNFSAKVSGGSHPYRYSWAFGDGGTGGNLENISHVYTTNGPFVAAVTIIDAAGAIIRGSVNISTALNLSAFANVSFGAAPLPVGFASQVSGGIPGYHYMWTFGDGGTSALASPSHVYTAPGVYRVNLLATDQDGNAASDSWNVTVATGGGPVSVSLTASYSQVPLGSPDTVLAAVAGGEGAYSTRWTVPPAECRESGFLQLNCTATATGQYAVSLTVTDGAGNSGNATATFAVGSEYIVTPVSPERSVAATGISPWLAAGLAVAVGTIAVVLGAAVGRRGKGGGPPTSEPVDSRYDAFRLVGAAGSPPAPVSDPVDDLF
jgi:PKD repeat protein